MIDHKGIRGAAVSVFRANMFFLWFFAIPYPTVQRLSPLKICFRINGYGTLSRDAEMEPNAYHPSASLASPATTADLSQCDKTPR